MRGKIPSTRHRDRGQLLRGPKSRGPTGIPVLFLIEECLDGTNSHDRRIGADAVIRVVVQGHAEPEKLWRIIQGHETASSSDA